MRTGNNISLLCHSKVKVAQNSDISVRSLDSSMQFSARHHMITRGVARKPARFQVCKAHDKHGGTKPMLPPSLMRCLPYCWFLS